MHHAFAPSGRATAARARRMPAAFFVAAFAFASALLLSACGRSPTPPTPPGSAAAAGTAATSQPGRVLVVSIDGLRPEFYLEAGKTYDAPHLRALMQAGSFVEQCESIFPSLTYPAHTSIVTGVRSARHGITSNGVYLDGSRQKHAYHDGDWYWYADEIRVPTLWDAARARGLRTGAVSWPVTVGARIDILVPECWPARGGGVGYPDLQKRLANPAGLAAATAKGPIPTAGLGEPELDAWIGHVAAGILRQNPPDLLLVHLLQVDHKAHQQGRSGKEVADAVHRADAALGEMLDAVKKTGGFERTTVIVTGDHGFVDVRASLAPNALFQEAGLLRSRSDCKAWAHAAGTQAAIYLRDPADRATATKVLALLEAHALDQGKRLYTILSRADLDRLAAYPGALCALDAEDGYSISGTIRDTLLGRSPHKGSHGSDPSRPQLATGLVLAGRGVKPGARLPRARLVDIAPTVARLLKLDMAGTEGRVLEELLSE
ncbi:MAG: alkaline phosphatase family protein [Planctomycetes bacterium]|nr:alkaline phosphatase family protein [Planctomycetota bacterium]